MGVSGAVVWWEEWQLRVLVLCSLLIQYFLLAASVARKFPIRSYFRPFIWLAYLGSDAVAIYALAVLFNRHRKPQQPEEDGEGGGSRLLEVLWAPILLMHLGGQDGITAYNIEDNELWTRHILTSVSQVVVAVYVFWKSWSGNDMRLLQAATLLFILGILRCFEKPFALNRASINSLVSSGEPVWRSINTHKLKIDPLEDFIDKATNPAEENIYLLAPSMPADFTPHKLFVDLASPSANDRIRVLLSFSALDDNHAYFAYDELKSIDIQQSVEERELTSVMRRELIRNKEGSITRKNIKRGKVLEREFTSVVQRERIREKVGGTISQLEGDKQTQKERELSQRIIIALDGRGSPPTDGTQQKTGIINDAWTIAKVLSGLPEEKMWTMIEGVWVEMMCFSAARCRGYLHAKGLATGVEYLTYVWLLQYYMGMETLADKLQRADHHHHAPSTSGVSKEATQQEQAASPSRSSGSASQSAGTREVMPLPLHKKLGKKWSDLQ
ncbi:hypothetical protein ZWY2020_031813 [Hordeum vulgare]|nr:hypothetical protein ZWY2020_031813 [Hordeum vulgare]